MEMILVLARMEKFLKWNVLELFTWLKKFIPFYAPINIMPHYPPPGLYRGIGGAFDLF